MLVVLGIRQGIFGHTDLDHFLGPDGVSFKCEAVRDVAPLFVSNSSRLAFSVGPETDRAANDELKTLMRGHGICLGEGEYGVIHD
jgi:hypothetical protein